MRNIFLTLLAAMAVLTAGAATSWGADMSRGVRGAETSPHCWRTQVCGPAGCEWRRQCWTGCLGGRESRFTCGALYGAYGPWGGRGYWDGFTMGFGQPY
jgi:hypothetical protein